MSVSEPFLPPTVVGEKEIHNGMHIFQQQQVTETVRIRSGTKRISNFCVFSYPGILMNLSQRGISMYKSEGKEGPEHLRSSVLEMRVVSLPHENLLPQKVLTS